MINHDINKIYTFIKTINEFKSVERLSLIKEKGRRESDAEHSWHLAIFAFLLAPSYSVDLDTLRCLKMALIHDLVELYAGDRYAFDPSNNPSDKKNAELKAIKILKKQLPNPLGEELYHLWLEYEQRNTEESKFVWALDKLLPRIQWVMTKGDLSDQLSNDKKRRNYQNHLLEQMDPIFVRIMKLYKKDRKKLG